MNKPKINKVSKEKLGAVKKERNTSTTKGALFSEFDDLKPGGDAVEVSIVTEDGDTDKQLLQYIRSLASMYTRNETDEKKIATSTNADKTMAYVYAKEL